MRTIRLDTTNIVDETSFHEVFKELLEFPDYYGANMEAWIECMTEIGEEELETTGLKLEPNEALIIEVEKTESFAKRVPEIFTELIVCTSFVNQQYIEDKGRYVVQLVFL